MYACVCPEGYTGTQCGTEIDECESSPCQNGGTCTDMLRGYDCQCTDEYIGVNCGVCKYYEIKQSAKEYTSN